MARRICSHYPFVGQRICPWALHFPPAYRRSILAPSGNSHPSRTDRWTVLALESDMQILTPIIFQYLSVKFVPSFCVGSVKQRSVIEMGEILFKAVLYNEN